MDEIDALLSAPAKRNASRCPSCNAHPEVVKHLARLARGKLKGVPANWEDLYEGFKAAIKKMISRGELPEGAEYTAFYNNFDYHCHNHVEVGDDTA